jgi:putative flippase GtrA
VIAEARRFVVVGISNLAVTYLIYLVLLHRAPPTLAFIGAAAVGIFYTTVLNITFVFKNGITMGRFLATIAYQLLYTVANVAVFNLFVAILPLPPWSMPFPVMLVMVPIHFACSKSLALGGPSGWGRKFENVDQPRQ